MIEDRGLDDPLLKNDTNCCKKHLKTIIFILVGLALIAAIIIVILILTKKDNKPNPAPDDEEVKTYEFGLSMDELKNKTNPKSMFQFVFLKPDSVEYTSLKEGDKKALKYLVKAAMILQNIHYRIDEINNIPFKKFLEKEVKTGNEQAILTKMVFDGQKGINVIDSLGKEINLAKGIRLKPGMEYIQKI